MKTNFKNFEIQSEYTGSKKAEWSNNTENWNHHEVIVTNTESNEQTTFDFWASIANPELSSEYDVLNAFYCFVGDAVSGSYSFEEFCSEFGYDTDSRKAEKTWKACQESYNNLLNIYDGDIYDLVNELSEIAG